MNKGRNQRIRQSARRLQWTAAFVAGLLLLAGCEQRELCYEHPHPNVSIVFDWSEAPDATPSTMVVYFFPTDNSQYIRLELTGDGTGSRAGFDTEVRVPPGTYNVVCHNGDTDNNVEQGTVFSDYHITTYDTGLLAPLNRSDDAPRPEGTEGQPVRAGADRLYACTLSEQVTLTQTGNDVKVIVMKPQRKSAVINVTINNVENLSPGMEFCGAISGLGESWHAATGKAAGRDTTVPLLLSANEPATLKGSVEVFGDNYPHDIPHKFRLYTSNKYYYDFDITDRMHTAPDPYNVDIILDGVVLHNTVGGMGVSVGEWDSGGKIDISM